MHLKSLFAKKTKCLNNLGSKTHYYIIVFVWSQYDGGSIEQRTIGYGCRQNQEAKIKIVAGVIPLSNQQYLCTVTFSLSHPPLFYQGTLVTFCITFPLCFGTASTSNVTAKLNSRERGGASDTKNPDPYYSVRWLVEY